MLLEESTPAVLVVQPVSGQHFDGDLAAETRVACAIDFAHPARAKRAEHLVDTEASPDTETHGQGNYRSAKCQVLSGVGSESEELGC